MDSGHPLLAAASLTLTPDGGTVAVADDAGTQLATLDGAGTVRDAGGAPLLTLRVEEPRGARRDHPGAVKLEIADASGAPLGTANVTKYGFGPRSKKLNLAVQRPDGEEAARFDVVDDRGEELSVTAGEVEVGTLSIETIKKGFLRRARVYTLRVASPPEPGVHALVLGAAIGFEGLLDAALAAAMRD